MLSVCDSGAGFVELPRLCRLNLRVWPDIRILHDHARTGDPSQNGNVDSGTRKIHGSLIETHCFAQRVKCRCARSSTAVAYAGSPQTLPYDASVIGPLVLALNLC